MSEKILSAHARRDVRAGDTAVCRVDLVIGTDASTPMALDCQAIEFAGPSLDFFTLEGRQVLANLSVEFEAKAYGDASLGVQLADPDPHRQAASALGSGPRWYRNAVIRRWWAGQYGWSPFSIPNPVVGAYTPLPSFLHCA